MTKYFMRYGLFSSSPILLLTTTVTVIKFGVFVGNGGGSEEKGQGKCWSDSKDINKKDDRVYGQLGNWCVRTKRRVRGKTTPVGSSYYNCYKKKKIYEKPKIDPS